MGLNSAFKGLSTLNSALLHKSRTLKNSMQGNIETRYIPHSE